MFWSWMILIYLALPVLILVSCVRVVIRATTAGRRGPKAPACEQCKYPIEGLSGWQCPECGNDVRQTGIITRAMEVRRRGTMAGAILALTVGVVDLGIVGGWVAWWAYLTWGGGFTAMGMGSTTMSTPLTPSSGAYAGITVESTYDWSGGAATATGMAGTVAYALELNDGSVWTLEFDAATSMAVAQDARGRAVALNSTDPSALTFEEFYSTAGLDVDDTSISAELSDIARTALLQIQAPYQDPSVQNYRQFTVGMTITTSAPTTVAAGSTAIIDWGVIIPWAVFSVSTTLWIGGLVWIILRRRKLLGADSAAGATSANQEPVEIPV